MELAGLIAVVVSVLVLAWQSREVAKQTRIANAQARMANEPAEASGVTSMDALQPPLSHLLVYPHLRPYFCRGTALADCPSADQASQVETLAEMFADGVEMALEAGHLAGPYRRHLADWESYAAHLLRNSPAVEALIREQGADWYPRLHAFYVQTNSPLA